jgi:L-lactate utilization protein LutC
MMSRTQFLKAASFTAAIMLVEYCFNSGNDHEHEHHHHHHHHDLNQEVEEVVSHYLMKLVNVTVTGLMEVTRFAVSGYSNNNFLAVGVSETALGFLRSGGHSVTAALRGVCGAGIALGINAVADKIHKPVEENRMRKTQ